MQLSLLDFGSYLTYSTKGTSKEEQHSKNWMYLVKNDEYFVENQNSILMSELIADKIKANVTTLPFATFFAPNTILVPAPSSSLMQDDTLWVPKRLATAMVKRGLGKSVIECLVRSTPVRKAATSLAKDRPTPQEQYDTMGVQKALTDPEEILIIDDIITRGATLMGAANRLFDVYPKAKIRAFAAMRAMSPPFQFTKIYDPIVGTIKLISPTNTIRRP
jgi:predicted amidophosphoribosyltransferase